jgi:hypothetical protein
MEAYHLSQKKKPEEGANGVAAGIAIITKQNKHLRNINNGL